MKSHIYSQPKYYEIAFNFMDTKKQVKLFERFIKKYSKINVKKVLDIACGPALQLREFAKKDYESIGIDYNPKMVNYLKNISRKENLKMKILKSDMNKFHLKNKVDFSYIMMGSIIYAKNNDSLLSHLDSVANSLNSGGLYLIENLAINWSDPKLLKSQSWTMREKGVKVKSTYKITSKDAIKQIVTQNFTLEVDNKGEKQKFTDQTDLKLFFPEEFKLLIEKNNKFEFLGFFERNSVKKLKDISPENIILLRKK